MNLSRRRFLSVAPAIILTPGLLMPVKPVLGVRPRLVVSDLSMTAYTMLSGAGFSFSMCVAVAPAVVILNDRWITCWGDGREYKGRYDGERDVFVFDVPVET